MEFLFQLLATKNYDDECPPTMKDRVLVLLATITNELSVMLYVNNINVLNLILTKICEQ